MNHTVFGDLRQRALAVYRVKTRSSEYILGIHELRGRKFVIARGEPGTDREHVVARDSDPRVGDHSLFELPIAEWPGKALEIATMTSSTIESVTVESDPTAIAAVGVDGKVERNPWARPAGENPIGGAAVALPPPPGMSESPRIVPSPSRGTRPVDVALRDYDPTAQQIVSGQTPEPRRVEVPYPQRHVAYAETVVQFLRSIANRDRLFDDLASDRTSRDRLRAALDDSVMLLEQIRRRDRR